MRIEKMPKMTVNEMMEKEVGLGHAARGFDGMTALDLREDDFRGSAGWIKCFPAEVTALLKVGRLESGANQVDK